MDIGNKGLCKGNLVIPQGCALSFTIVHRNEDGTVIDHSGSTPHLHVLDDKCKRLVADLSGCVHPEAARILVDVPGSATHSIRPGSYPYDLILASPSHGSIRVLYGEVKVEDTYSLDEA